ncbi:M28 family peptidase [bacterium]|nr:MAG: M28 family peptidase [bacterium]
MILAAVLLAQAQPALKTITPESLKAHVRWLADDERGGRATPSPGGDASAEYVAKEFGSFGAKPVNGSYFQEVPITRRGSGKSLGTARNVVGLLKGSDPKRSGEIVVLSAHYDHLGTRPGRGPDSIYNGANDDASGVAGMIEAGRALAKMRPARSVLLIGFCAEELGLVGSSYYGEHPLLPLKDTVGMVELEQIGRTDDSEGARVGAFTVTGFTFSDLPRTLGLAAGTVNVKAQDSPNGDPYFVASDNVALAIKGVPAHTVSVAFSYPDYHGPADTWDKLDYVNMAKVVRAVTLGIKRLAEGHGGEVGVSSVVGEGTVFWVELPAPRVAAAPVAATA